MSVLRRFACALVSAPFVVLAACSAGSSGTGTGAGTANPKNCDTTSPQDVRPLGSSEGGSCSSSSDCNPIACACTDGSGIDSIRSCDNNSCTGEVQCKRLCTDHGGVKSSGPAASGGPAAGTGDTTNGGATAPSAPCKAPAASGSPAPGAGSGTPPAPSNPGAAPEDQTSPPDMGSGSNGTKTGCTLSSASMLGQVTGNLQAGSDSECARGPIGLQGVCTIQKTGECAGTVTCSTTSPVDPLSHFKGEGTFTASGSTITGKVTADVVGEGQAPKHLTCTYALTGELR